MASSIISFYRKSKIDESSELQHKYLIVENSASSEEKNIRVVTYTFMTKGTPDIEPILLTNVTSDEAIDKAVAYLKGLIHFQELDYVVHPLQINELKLDNENP